MKALAHGLIVAAVAGHIGLTICDAWAKPGGSAAGVSGPSAASSSASAGPSSSSTGAASATGGGASGTGASGVGHGHSGAAGVDGVGVGVTGGRDGPPGHGYGSVGDPAPAASSQGGGPPVFIFPPEFTASTAPAGACGAAPELPDTSWYNDPVDGIEVISQQTQNYLRSCGCETQACVADALEKYANALEKAVAPAPPIPGLPPVKARKLPRAVRELPRIVHEAAARVRAAPTRAVAAKAVQAAIEIVQKTAAKTIAFARADDPDAKKIAARGTDLVLDTLKSAQESLVRADAL